MTQRIDKPDTKTDELLKICLDSKTSFTMTAGAGSGKTTSLIKALDYIRRTQGDILRKRKQKIACITYTKVAVKEIWDDVGEDSLFHVSTIHSFLWDNIKPFQVDIKKWVIQRVDEKLDDLKNKTFGPRTQQKTIEKNQKDIDKYEGIKSQIDKVHKFNYGTGSDYVNGILGHDDIIKMAPLLITESSLLRAIIAQKYPFFFIDESQDTIKELINAVKEIDRQMGKEFCLGFFGDPMQKIYLTGVGKIEIEQDWTEIDKLENFRSSQSVLKVINNIRLQDDKLNQISGIKKPLEGSTKIFILPTSSNRVENIEKIRNFMAKENKDPLWISDEKEADVKILVIVHRMAANRLGFPDLYSAFNDNSTESIKSSFNEGTSWILQPFQHYLIPLLEANKNAEQFEVMRLLRTYCPKLTKENLKNLKFETSKLFESLKQDIQALTDLLGNNEVKIREILEFVEEKELILIDERIRLRLKNIDEQSISDDSDNLEKLKSALEAYFSCPAIQLWGYKTYIEDESPYSTQHGIKGAEFERVLVILDDEEGTHRQYSYEKLFDLAPPSDNDIKNQREGNETIYDRTRRLFYVCCSRALKDLAIIFFVPDVTAAMTKIKNAKIFENSNILGADNIKK